MLGFVRLWSAFEAKRANYLPIGWQILVTLIKSIGGTIMNGFNVHVDVISGGHRDSDFNADLRIPF